MGVVHSATRRVHVRRDRDGPEAARHPLARGIEHDRGTAPGVPRHEHDKRDGHDGWDVSVVVGVGLMGR